MKIVVRIIALVTLSVGVLMGCGSEPDVAACKAAMKEQFSTAADQTVSAERPPECEGVDDETLQRLAGEIIAESLEG